MSFSSVFFLSAWHMTLICSRYCFLCMSFWCWTTCDSSSQLNKRFSCSFCWYKSIITDDCSKPACAAPSGCSKLPLSQCSLNIICQDQIGDKPIWFTTLILPLRNQAILETPAISVTLPYGSQCFLTVNSPMLSSKLTVCMVRCW